MHLSVYKFPRTHPTAPPASVQNIVKYSVDKIRKLISSLYCTVGRIDSLSCETANSNNRCLSVWLIGGQVSFVSMADSSIRSIFYSIQVVSTARGSLQN